MAVSTLNGLLGNIDKAGGILVPRPVPYQPLPPFQKDVVAQRGVKMERIDEGKGWAMANPSASFFARNVLSGKPYRPNVLFLITPTLSFPIRALIFS